MTEGQLLHDKTIKGWRCDSCGWAWPTPRFIPAHQNVDRAHQEDFDKHRCSEHPLRAAEALNGELIEGLQKIVQCGEAGGATTDSRLATVRHIANETLKNYRRRAVQGVR
jgi:hypothetical protein